MDETGLYELLALLSDAAGLTSPHHFVHKHSACSGQPTDFGQLWQCPVCNATASKSSLFGQSSPAARSFVSSKLGHLGHQMPMVVPTEVTEHDIRKALGITPEQMTELLEQVTRPEPKTALEHIDQDLRKYTGRI